MADVTLASDIDATWTNSGGPYDAGELRRADAAMFSSGGVARGLDVTVTASDVVRVAAGSWVIDGDKTSLGAGVYRGGIGSQVSASLEARDATYGRIDLVVARQYDPDVVGSHTTSGAAVEVLTGTPSANPSAPALPDLAEEVCRLDVPADGGGAVAVDTSHRRRSSTQTELDKARMVKSSGQPVSPEAFSRITWDSAEYNIGGIADVAFNRVLIRRSGFYRLTLAVLWSSAADSARRQVDFRVNGSYLASGQLSNITGTQGSARWTHNASVEVELSAGDDVDLFAWHNAPSSREIASTGTAFMVSRLP